MAGVPACRTEIERFECATPARRGFSNTTYTVYSYKVSLQGLPPESNSKVWTVTSFVLSLSSCCFCLVLAFLYWFFGGSAVCTIHVR